MDASSLPAYERSVDLASLNISKHVPIERIPNNVRRRLLFPSLKITQVFQTQPFAIASFPPFNPPPSPIRIIQRIEPERIPCAKLVIERIGREGRAVAAELVAGRVLIERIGAEIAAAAEDSRNLWRGKDVLIVEDGSRWILTREGEGAMDRARRLRRSSRPLALPRGRPLLLS